MGIFPDYVLSDLFSGLEGYATIGLAVSGGGDSTALMLLIKRWLSTRHSPPRVCVFTVDHGLRASAALEAQQVCLWAQDLGFCAHVLKWLGEKPKTQLQARARQARYALLEAACLQENCQALLTAHTAEDQAETFLMRLKRGSGLDGLSEMKGETTQGLPLLRPLLPLRRKDLRCYLREQKHPWIEDESNTQEIFERIQLRRFLETLEEKKISSSAIALSAQRLRRARNALDHLAQELYEKTIFLKNDQEYEVKGALFREAPEELRIRVLALLFKEFYGFSGAYTDLRAIERLEEWMSAGKSKARTLKGCFFKRTEQGFLCTKAPPRKHLFKS